MFQVAVILSFPTVLQAFILYYSPREKCYLCCIRFLAAVPRAATGKCGLTNILPVWYPVLLMHPWFIHLHLPLFLTLLRLSTLFPSLHPFFTHPPLLRHLTHSTSPPRSRCKLRGLSSLKALTPVALIAAAVAPTLAAWMAMNISSGGEEERRVSGGGRGRLGRGAEQVRTEEAHAWTSGMGMGRGRRGGR